MYAGTKVVLSIGVMLERSDRGFAITSLLAVAPGGVQSFFSRSADCILRITRSQISCLPPPVAESVDELESIRCLLWELNLPVVSGAFLRSGGVLPLLFEDLSKEESI